MTGAFDLARPFDMAGKTAVVTGGGRGLGLAIARQLDAAGARVMIVGRSRSTLEAACSSVSARTLCHVVDISDEDSVGSMRDAALAALGQVDVLVNNAGVNPYYHRTEETPLAEWSELISINLTGTFLCCRAFAPSMLHRGKGSIINVTSIAAHSGLSRTAAYCAAKGGVEAMSRSMAHDWAKSGVRVNCVAPGYVSTDLTTGLERNDRLAGDIIAKTPVGRFGTPEEIAGAVLFLAADSSSYVTGATVGVDGGWTAI